MGLNQISLRINLLIILNRLSNAKAVYTTKLQRRIQEHYLAIIFMSVEDSNWDGGCLLQEINNDVLKEQSKFTATLVEALSMINKYLAIASTPRTTNEYKEVVF